MFKSTSVRCFVVLFISLNAVCPGSGEDRGHLQTPEEVDGLAVGKEAGQPQDEPGR